MGVREAVVYDLFCGPGTDANGVKGSPVRAADVVRNSEDLIKSSNVPLRLVFNDFESSFIHTLKSSMGNSVQADNGEKLATIEYFAKSFQELFPTLVPSMAQKAANFLFIDQFGATKVDANVFRALHSLPTTDVLFFLSSDWFRRFSDSPEAKDWGISKTDIMRTRYNEIHRFMAEYFLDLVGGDYLVAPFSLKKGSNVYGLIFASHHYVWLYKFLKIAWKEDPHYGEANFDMFDERVGTDQLTIFGVRKVEDFQSALKQKILAGEFESDSDIFLYMLQRGFINKHAREVVKELTAKKGGVIEFQESGVRKDPRFSPDAVKHPRQLVFRE